MSSAALSFDPEAGELLEQLAALLGERTGLMLTRAHWNDLRRAVTTVAQEIGCPDWLSGLKLLASRNGINYLPQLIDHLTVGETYFFRDGALFKTLRERLLPELISARRDRGNYVRIWSAGCCSGEEPYSIAIELLRLLPDWRHWQLTLLATDINRIFLKKAKRGIYERWSLRHKPSTPYAPYLIPLAKGRFEVAPAVRDLVIFEHLNLASHLYPSPLTNTQSMDIILCRNVLMYLQPECISDVIARLSACLVEGGWLITSTIEATLVQRPELHAVRLPDIVLFRKRCEAEPLSPPQGIEKIAPRDRLPGNRSNNLMTQKTGRSFAFNRVEITGDVAPASPLVLSLTAARELANQGMLAAAREECQKILAIEKLNIEATFLHATILLEMNALTEAKEWLQRTLYLDETHIVGHVALATLLQQAACVADAQRHWRRALKLLHGLPEHELVRDSDDRTVKQMRDMVSAMLVTN